MDANTVVSAALNPGGIPRQALAAARARGVIVLSEAVYEEINEVLARPKCAFLKDLVVEISRKNRQI
ncbi:hypothetical protein [Lichenicoccus sp.]|uniref:hypothetical protein n=1 Tax=Lichenicoccus sp. TaxID=2781899 RepID=UPI003D1368D7